MTARYFQTLRWNIAEYYHRQNFLIAAGASWCLVFLLLTPLRPSAIVEERKSFPG